MDIRDNPSVGARELDVFRHYMLRSINGADTNILDSTIASSHFVVRVDLVELWEEAKAKALKGEDWDLTTLCNGTLLADDARRFNEITSEQVVVGKIEQLEQDMRSNAARFHAQRECRTLWRDIGAGNVSPENASARFEAAGSTLVDCVADDDSDSVSEAKAAVERMLTGEPAPLLPMPLLGSEYEGWTPGKLYVVGAVTSQHKTTVCLDACTLVEESGANAFFWTLEDSRADMSARQIVQASEGRISFNDLTRGIGKRGPKVKIAIDSMRTIEERPGRTFLRDGPGTIDVICSAISKKVANHGIRLAVIDFIQRITPDNKFEAPHDAYERYSKRLADLAGKLDIVILLAVQFTKDATSKSTEGHGGKDRLPQIGDIKGGSGIAYNAFGVWLNHIPQGQDDDLVLKEMSICIRKWKSGNPRVFKATVEGRRLKIRLDMSRGNGVKVFDGGKGEGKNRSGFYGAGAYVDKG